MTDKQIWTYMDKIIANEKRNFIKLDSFYNWDKNNKNIPTICDTNEIKTGLLIKKIKKENNENNIVKFTVNNFENKKIEYNAFINIPYNYYATGYKWVAKVGTKLDKTLSDSCYANRVSIDNRRDIFKFYVESYNEFRDNAIEVLEKQDENESVIVFNYDLSRYFYNIDIKKLFQICDTEFESIKLTKHQKELHEFIKAVIIEYSKKETSKIDCNSMGLPIEFPPSNILSNLYLKDFDENILSKRPIYYGRYVDDMIIMFKYIPGKNDIVDYIDNFYSNLKELSLNDNNTNEKIKTFIFENTNKIIVEIFRDYLLTFSSDFNKILDVYDIEQEIKKNCYDVIGLNNKISSLEDVKLKSIEFAKIISTLEYITTNGHYITTTTTPDMKNLFEEQIKYIIKTCDDVTIIERYDYWSSILLIEKQMETNFLEQRIKKIIGKMDDENGKVVQKAWTFVNNNIENYKSKKKLSHIPKWKEVIEMNIEGKL